MIRITMTTSSSICITQNQYSIFICLDRAGNIWNNFTNHCRWWPHIIYICPRSGISTWTRQTYPWRTFRGTAWPWTTFHGKRTNTCSPKLGDFWCILIRLSRSCIPSTWEGNLGEVDIGIVRQWRNPVGKTVNPFLWCIVQSWELNLVHHARSKGSIFARQISIFNFLGESTCTSINLYLPT